MVFSLIARTRPGALQRFRQGIDAAWDDALPLTSWRAPPGVVSVLGWAGAFPISGGFEVESYPVRIRKLVGSGLIFLWWREVDGFVFLLAVLCYRDACEECRVLSQVVEVE
jgi:hypothetical protein